MCQPYIASIQFLINTNFLPVRCTMDITSWLISFNILLYILLLVLFHTEFYGLDDSTFFLTLIRMSPWLYVSEFLMCVQSIFFNHVSQEVFNFFCFKILCGLTLRNFFLSLKRFCEIIILTMGAKEKGKTIVILVI